MTDESRQLPPALHAPLGRRGALLGAGGIGAALLAAGARAAAAQQPLKVAAVFATPIEEPWVRQIHEALVKARAEHGIDYQYSEHVAAADFARVMREYAEKGANLLMGDAFSAETIVRRVARQYPRVAFVFGSGQGPAAPNFGVFDNWIHEPAYLSGLIAGKMTKKNSIGAVAAMDIPEVARLVNAFKAGAREANRDVRFRVTFIGSFFDPPKAKEAAIAQIEAGADVLFAERFGVIEACKERGAMAISNMSDQSALAPDTVITGPVWDMWPTVDAAIKQVRAGVFTAQDFGSFSFMAQGGSRLAPFHAWEQKLPEEVKALVAKRTQEILDGDFRVNVDESTPRSD